MDNLEIFPSTRSLGDDSYGTTLTSTATLVYPGNAFANYDFISVLGLAQRLNIDILPVMWQNPLGKLGRGGQGKINQSVVSVGASFAFKVFDHLKLDPFREIVQEMVVLSDLRIRFHPNILRLHGICWNIPRDDQVWPVLVFQKSHFGDLYHFMKSEKASSMSLEDKLKLCVDIGTAIRDMHLNGIIHGDIKPQNILVFEDEDISGAYTAKVADFGFSTYFRNENDLIRVPKSVPWHAPEYEEGPIEASAAKSMDIYSLGLTCLWILLRSCSVAATYADRIDKTLFTHATKEMDPVEYRLYGGDDQLAEWAVQQMAKYYEANSEILPTVTRILRNLLAYRPEQRASNLDEELEPLRFVKPLPSPVKTRIDYTQQEEYFELGSSIFAFYSSDYRLRYFIARSLESMVSMGPSLSSSRTPFSDAALQLAICYRIGFGVTRDLEESKRVFGLSLRYQEVIENDIDSIKENDMVWRLYGRTVELLANHGHMVEINWPQYYRERNVLMEAIKDCRREITDLQEEFGEGHQLAAHLKGQLAKMLHATGESSQAKDLSMQVYETKRRIFGDEHPYTTISLLESTEYQTEQNWNKLDNMETRVLETCKEVLGDQNPMTLMSIARLAARLREHGWLEEAAKLEVELMETTLEVFGEHRFTIGSLAGLGRTYSQMGRHKEAESLAKQALAMSKRILGEDHEVTQDTTIGLASILSDQGRWTEAQRIAVQLVETTQRTHGPNHLDTIRNRANLGLILVAQGLWNEAEELQKDLLDISRTTLGEGHMITVLCMSHLASTYRNKKQFDLAQGIEERVLERKRQYLNENHPEILIAMSNLALTYDYQEKPIQAEQLFKETIEKWEAMLGPKHPSTLKAKGNLASLYRKQNRWQQAQELGSEVVEALMQVLGEGHPSTIVHTINLCSALAELGQNKEAEDRMEGVVEICKKTFGDNHHLTLTALNNMASIYFAEERWSEAKELQIHVLDMSRKVLGEEHPDVLLRASNLVESYIHEERWDKVEELEARILPISIKVLGAEHSDTLVCKSHLAHCLKLRGPEDDILPQT